MTKRVFLCDAPQYQQLLKDSLSKSALLQHVSQVVGKRGGVYVVGGFVRDTLLNRDPKELDLVVEGDPLQIASKFGSIRKVHQRFCTVEVQLADGTLVDLAMARSETYSNPGALPKVRPASIKQDLLRRDFTVNALAFELASHKFYAVERALEDLQNKQLRVLHAKSFFDDPTRLFRLVRYLARLRFQIEDKTAEFVKSACRAKVIERLTPARIGSELFLLAQEQSALRAFRLLTKLKLCSDISFSAQRCQQALNLSRLSEQERIQVILACALADWEGKYPMEKRKMQLTAYGFQRKQISEILAAPCAFTLAQKLLQTVHLSEVDKILAKQSLVQIVLSGACGAHVQVQGWLDALSQYELNITGQDLLAAGVPAGKEVGLRLQYVRHLLLDGELSSGYEHELKAAVDRYGTPD